MLKIISPHARRLPSGTHQRGVTLVEILVTLVVISVGLLGVAALHMVSLRNGLNAHVRSQATSMAHDIIDRMRANRTAAVGGQYNIAVGATIAATGLIGTDLTAWRNALKAALPNGDGGIATATVTTPGGTVSTLAIVTIQWGERTQDATAASSTETLSFETRAEI